MSMEKDNSTSQLFLAERSESTLEPDSIIRHRGQSESSEKNESTALDAALPSIPSTTHTPTDLKNHPNIAETAEYKVYIQWKAQAPSERKLKRLEDFLRVTGLTRADIALMKAHPSFESDLVEATFAWAKTQTPKLFHLMFDKIVSKQNSQDLKLWVDMVTDKKTGPSPQINVFNFSDNLGDKQRQQILERLQRKNDE